jgi:hypothetical protein
MSASAQSAPFVSPIHTQRLKAQSKLLRAWIERLPTLKNWHRRTANSVIDPNDHTTLQQQHLELKDSALVPDTVGVYAKKHFKADSIHRLSTYPGYLVTSEEYNTMPFICQTGVHLHLLTTPQDTHIYILVGDPRSVGANVNDKRGTAVRINTAKLCMRRPGCTSAIRWPTATNKGLVGDTFVSVYSNGYVIQPGEEITISYGKGLWTDFDSILNTNRMIDTSNDTSYTAAAPLPELTVRPFSIPPSTNVAVDMDVHAQVAVDAASESQLDELNMPSFAHSILSTPNVRERFA